MNNCLCLWGRSDYSSGIMKHGCLWRLGFLWFWSGIYFVFIGVELLYSVVLVSPVQQCESALCTHVSPPFWVSFPAHPASHASGSSQSPAPSCLCCIEASHQLSVLHMVSAALSTHPTLYSPSVSTSPFFLSGIYNVYPVVLIPWRWDMALRGPGCGHETIRHRFLSLQGYLPFRSLGEIFICSWELL